MPGAKLIDVVRLAYKNPHFLDSLLRDVDKALKDAGLELSQKEKAKLHKLMNEPLQNTGREVLKLLSQINAKEIDKNAPPPEPPW
jgi:hypothetical protein